MAKAAVVADQTQIRLSSVKGHWEAAIEDSPHNVVIVSPYLTSTTAIEVITKANPRRTIILTAFRAELFALGGSSLDTIRELRRLGFRIKYLPDIHAKIVIAGKLGFLGSQNVTNGGTKNREATAVISDKALVSELRSSIGRWCRDAQPVTDKLLAFMEDRVAELRERASSLQDELARIDYDLDAQVVRRQVRAARERQHRKDEKKRKEAEEKATLAARVRDEQRRRETRLAVSRTIAESVPLAGAARLTLRPLNKPPTLAVDPGVRLTELGGERLRKLYRYCLFNPLTLQLCWARWAGTRLSKFSVGKTHDIDHGGSRIKLHVNVNLDQASLKDWNLSIGLGEGEEREIRILFTIRDHKVTGFGRDVQPRERSKKFLQNILYRYVINAFEFGEKSKLDGLYADDFLRKTMPGSRRLTIQPYKLLSDNGDIVYFVIKAA